MNSINRIKNKLAPYKLELLGAAILVTTAVVSYQVGRTLAPKAPGSIIMGDGIGLAATKDMLHHMNATNDGVLFDVEEGSFLLKKVNW